MTGDPVVSETAPALALDGVTVRFGGVVAVDDVSMTVRPGERRAVIGPNGAGKTTLFRAVSGEVLPNEGRVELFGRDITRKPPNRRAHLGIGRTYQVTNLFPALTVLDNVAVAAHGLSRQRYFSWRPVRLHGVLGERADRALEQVGLANRRDRKVNELSHGEQRQLELALALAGQPRVLLLDEPAAGLSASERVRMRDLILDLPEDLALILIEHDMDLALRLVDWVTVLDNGRQIADGPPDEVRENEEVQAVYLRSE
jgi:branched-chain amino acid transport system ATP-binding protein